MQLLCHCPVPAVSLPYRPCTPVLPDIPPPMLFASSASGGGARFNNQDARFLPSVQPSRRQLETTSLCLAAVLVTRLFSLCVGGPVSHHIANPIPPLLAPLVPFCPPPSQIPSLLCCPSRSRRVGAESPSNVWPKQLEQRDSPDSFPEQPLEKLDLPSLAALSLVEFEKTGPSLSF